MYYLATVCPQGQIIEIVTHMHLDTLEAENAEISLIMLTEFKTFHKWEDMKLQGFKIIKLQQMA